MPKPPMTVLAEAFKTQTARIEASFSDLAAVFGDSLTAFDTGPKFSCGEADLIALALAQNGHLDAAVVWLTGHARGEGYEDSHCTWQDENGEALNKVIPFTEEQNLEYIERMLEELK